MKKWQGVHVRSREALNKLTFTVDLVSFSAVSVVNTEYILAAFYLCFFFCFDIYLLCSMQQM